MAVHLLIEILIPHPRDADCAKRKLHKRTQLQVQIGVDFWVRFRATQHFLDSFGPSHAALSFGGLKSPGHAG